MIDTPSPNGPPPDTRVVTEVFPGIRTLEGAGFLVHRPFPTQRLAMLDPFLLLDEMGPSDLAPGEAKGAPDHPHRGFETVTYMLEGRLEHADSVGNRGSLGPGDVQWMTAGAGVVHSEMPSAGMTREGGRMHGFQLWVNLPAKSKMIAPRYQEIPADEIPVVSLDGGGSVRVIAGVFRDTTGAVETHSPVTYLHVTLSPGEATNLAVGESDNAGVYVFAGPGFLGSDARPVDAHELALLGPGSMVSATAGQDGLECLVLSGAPLGEPVTRYGPFVMNTRAEIAQAVEDYQSGRMGVIG